LTVFASLRSPGNDGPRQLLAGSHKIRKQYNAASGEDSEAQDLKSANNFHT